MDHKARGSAFISEMTTSYRSYDAVLMDAAETLFTTKGAVGEIYHYVAQRFGSPATAEEIQKSFVRDFPHSGPLATADEKEWWRTVVRAVFLEVGMVDDFDRFFDEVYDLFRDSRGWRLFPETRRVLEELKRHGLSLGIVSNFDSRIYSVLHDLGIRAFFDSITISSETGLAKPDPAIFLAAARSLGVPPNRLLFTGDALVDDYQAARNAGIEALLLDRSGRYAMMGSIRRIESLEELLVISTNDTSAG
jgi:putative hydrolase of the HAD superfamily